MLKSCKYSFVSRFSTFYITVGIVINRRWHLFILHWKEKKSSFVHVACFLEHWFFLVCFWIDIEKSTYQKKTCDFCLILNLDRYVTVIDETKFACRVAITLFYLSWKYLLRLNVGIWLKFEEKMVIFVYLSSVTMDNEVKKIIG